jgi:predicted aspartyl protease
MLAANQPKTHKYLTSKCHSSVILSQQDDQEVAVLLDGGAEVNVVSLKFAEKYGNNKTEWDGMIAPLDGRFVTNYGIIDINFKINNKVVIIPSVIVKDLGKYQVIFGLPALEQLSVQVDYKTGEAKINNKTYSLIPRIDNRYFGIRTVEKITVPPRCQKIIKVNVNNYIKGTHHRNFSSVISPSRTLINNSPLRTPNGVFKKSPDQFKKIILSNTSSIPINIAKNALVGHLTLLPYSVNTLGVNYDEDIIRDDDAIDFPVKKNETDEMEMEEKIKNQIDTDLNQEDSSMIFDILNTFKNIFAANPRGPPLATKTKCHVPLKEGAVPIRIPPYRASPKVLIELKKQIKEMLDNGIIKKGTSAWSFPVVLAPKPDGSWRFCVDYSKLSDMVHRDSYPLPRIDDTLEKLGKAKVFSTMDAASGYWQIPIVEEDKEKLAFTTPFGTYIWNRMPFGFCNSSGIFQRAMNETLDEYLFYCCLVYVDDIVVYSSSIKQHSKDLEKVFTVLEKFGWTLKLSKCKFGFSKLDFLGHTISHGQVQVAKININKLLNMKRPKNIKEVQSFLGLANYYRKFVNKFAHNVAPLYNLLRKDTEWNWTPECEKSFCKVVSLLGEYPILKIADFDKPFIIRTDASDLGMGMTLAQIHDGKEHPVAFHSIKFSPNQSKNWPTWKKEGCAVVSAIKYWHHYLAYTPFTLVTDHEALKRILDTTKTCKPIIDRWRIYLSQFKYKIIHRPGKELVIEDGMSRSLDFLPIVLKNLFSSQDSDPLIKECKDLINNPKLNPSSEMVEKFFKVNSYYFIMEDNNLFYYNPMAKKEKRFKRLIIGKEMITPLLAQYHDHPLSGHLGVEKTYEKLAKKFWFPDMYKIVKNYCQECYVCDQNRKFFKNNCELNPIISTFPTEIFEIDHIGPLPKIKQRPDPHNNKNYQYVLSVVDHFTRKRWFFPATTTEAEETFFILNNNIFCHFDYPKTILTDRGSAFENELSDYFIKLTGIDHRFALPNQHTTVGSVERSNLIIEEMIRKYVDQTTHADWDNYLPMLTYAINKSVCRSHGYNPDFLMFGRDATSPIEFKSTNTFDSKNFKNSYIKHFEKYWRKANKILVEYRNKMVEEHKKSKLGRRAPEIFKKGDNVWLYNSLDYRIKGINPTLTKRGLGPFKITQTLPGNNLKLQITPTKEIIVKQDVVRRTKAQVIGDGDFKLIPSLKEKIIITNPAKPPLMEKEVDIPTNLDTESVVGKRIKIYWPSNKKWYTGTIIGYKNSKLGNLIYYDEPTTGVDSRDEDFYECRLFKTKTNNKPDKWKLLEEIKF